MARFSNGVPPIRFYDHNFINIADPSHINYMPHATHPPDLVNLILSGKTTSEVPYHTVYNFLPLILFLEETRLIKKKNQ